MASTEPDDLAKRVGSRSNRVEIKHGARWERVCAAGGLDGGVLGGRMGELRPLWAKRRRMKAHKLAAPAKGFIQPLERRAALLERSAAGPWDNETSVRPPPPRSCVVGPNTHVWRQADGWGRTSWLHRPGGPCGSHRLGCTRSCTRWLRMELRRPPVGRMISANDSEHARRS